MKGYTIVFIWSGATIKGTITEQVTGGVMGLKTVVETDHATYTLLGKCAVGEYCGPFKVISIAKPKPKGDGIHMEGWLN
jgi:hypothetical protein